MGAASSAKLLVSSSGKDTELDKNNYLQPLAQASIRLCDKFAQVDIFAKEMYINSPKLDALQHLLTDEAGKNAFMKFLKTEYAAENLEFFMVSSHLQLCTINSWY
jgi:hypothetical protein